MLSLKHDTSIGNESILHFYCVSEIQVISFLHLTAYEHVGWQNHCHRWQVVIALPRTCLLGKRWLGWAETEWELALKCFVGKTHVGEFSLHGHLQVHDVHQCTLVNDNSISFSSRNAQSSLLLLFFLPSLPGEVLGLLKLVSSIPPHTHKDRQLGGVSGKFP